MSKHATYSPSGLEKLDRCPCFEQGESKDQSATDAGTSNHQAVALEDSNLCADQEDADLVESCIQYKVSLRHDTPGGVEYNEIGLEVEGLTWGTTDFLLLSPDGTCAHVADWKFGAFPVTDAEENLQLQCYVLGVFERFELLERVSGHLVCPKQDEVTTHEYARADVPRLRERIIEVLDRCNDPDKQPTPAEDACMFCGVKGTCPAMLKTAEKVAQGLNLPIVFQPAELITVGDRAKAQILANVMEDWAKQIRKLNAEAVLEDGVDIPGFSLRRRTGTITVTDNELLPALMRDLLPEGADTNEVILECSSVSFAKLVDAVAEQKGTPKKDTRVTLLSALADVIKENNEVVYLQREKGKTYEEILEQASGNG